MILITKIYMCLACHAIGDYVLQTDFLASTKGKNFWHMLMHCLLYTIPFVAVFGLRWSILILFGTHLITDLMKASWKVISYVTDQAIHLFVIFLIYILLVLTGGAFQL